MNEISESSVTHGICGSSRKGQDDSQSKTEVLLQSECGGVNDIVFLLVHGTFAPNASWMENGSDLIQALDSVSADLGARPQYWKVRWSGANSTYDRLRAAHVIRRAVRSVRKDCPGAKCVLVCHSHGGTAATYAFGRHHPPPVDAAVFIASPFMFILPSTAGGATRVVANDEPEIGCTIGVLLTIAIGAYVIPWVGYDTSLQVFIGMGVSVLFANVVLLPVMSVLVHAKNAQLRLSRRLVLPGATAVSPNIFIVSSRTDEALMWLRLLAMPSAIISAVFSLLVGFAFIAVLSSAFALSLYGWGSLMVEAGESLMKFGTSGMTIGGLRHLLLIIFGAPLLLFIISGIALALFSLIPLFIMSALRPIFHMTLFHRFGWGQLPFHLGTDNPLRLACQPFEPAAVTYRRYRFRLHLPLRRLAHSLYQSPEFLADLKDWLSERLGKQGNTQQFRSK